MAAEAVEDGLQGFPDDGIGEGAGGVVGAGAAAFVGGLEDDGAGGDGMRGGAAVDALVAPGDPNLEPLQGLVVAGTGNGSLHQNLEAALLRAQAGGVHVWRATRCPLGRVLPMPGQRLPDSVGLSPVKARIALTLTLLD